MISRGVPHAYRFLFATIMVPPVIFPFDPSSSLVRSETSDPQVEFDLSCLADRKNICTYSSPRPRNSLFRIILLCYTATGLVLAICRSTFLLDPGVSLRIKIMDLDLTSPRKSIFRIALCIAALPGGFSSSFIGQKYCVRRTAAYTCSRIILTIHSAHHDHAY
jgi:hypothetical protein